MDEKTQNWSLNYLRHPKERNSLRNNVMKVKQNTYTSHTETNSVCLGSRHTEFDIPTDGTG